MRMYVLKDKQAVIVGNGYAEQDQDDECININDAIYLEFTVLRYIIKLAEMGYKYTHIMDRCLISKEEFVHMKGLTRIYKNNILLSIECNKKNWELEIKREENE